MGVAVEGMVRWRATEEMLAPKPRGQGYNAVKLQRTPARQTCRQNRG